MVVNKTSAGNSSPLLLVCHHSKRFDPFSKAIFINFSAFSIEFKPSG